MGCPLRPRACLSSQTLGDPRSSPTSRKTGLPGSAWQGPEGVFCCHSPILTLGKSAALPTPAQGPDHQVRPLLPASRPARDSGRGLICLHSVFRPGPSPNQPTAGQSAGRTGPLRPAAGFLVAADSKESACNSGGLGLIPGSGRSPGGGKGCPLQYSCLENSMDRGTYKLQPVGSQRDGQD